MKHPKYNGKIKHINIIYNCARNIVAHKNVNMKYISMHEITADSLMKPIMKVIFYRHRSH